MVKRGREQTIIDTNVMQGLVLQRLCSHAPCLNATHDLVIKGYLKHQSSSEVRLSE